MSDAKARKVRWAVRLGRPLIGALARSWRIEEHQTEHWQALRREGKPHILACWHGVLLPNLWANRQRGLCALVSQHGDGEIITRIMMGWGYRAVRGSSSRGGREALLAMVRELQQGNVFAITPDGPRGPAGEPQAGVLVAARRAAAPIVPLRTTLSASWALRSWDRFRVPKPFARIRISYGAPWMPTGDQAADLTTLRQLLGPAPEYREPAS